MDSFRESVLIAFSTPLFTVVILAEIIFSRLHDRKSYSVGGTVGNIYLMLVNMGLDIILRGACLFILNFFYHPAFTAGMNPVLYWTLLLVIQDFLFYVLHLVDHHVRFFWAVHVTHHSSEEFNLSVGFRSSVLQPLYRFVYFVPLAMLGFKPLDILFMYSATQIYGILLHTRYIRKMGWLEWILVTPSHHRVHHASNTEYLDRNMGMVFIIWDRLFGTFQKELDEVPVRYGLTKNITKKDPFNLIFHEWIQMWKDVRSVKGLKNKAGYIFNKPGWSHDGSRMTSEQMRKSKIVPIQKSQPSNFSSFNSAPSKTA